MRGKRLRVVYGNGKCETQNRVRRLVQDLMVHVLCVPRSLLILCVARSTFLSNFPTLVLGISSINAHLSGIHHLATLPVR